MNLREVIKETIDKGTHHHLYEELDSITDEIMSRFKELDWKTTTIGPERSAPDKTQIRFLFEDEWQALFK